MHELSQPTNLPISARNSASHRQISLLAIGDLVPATDNPRKHDRQQVRAIAKSIETFGFVTPILVDKNRQVVAGHGRLEAAKLLGLTQVPVVFLDHLTEAEAKAFRLADNQLAARSKWDDRKVAEQLKELAGPDLEFDLEAIGFELPELDLRIQSLDDPDEVDKADDLATATGPAVSVVGDLWLLGSHRVYCGNSLEPNAYETLMDGEHATAVLSDAPYNVPIAGHVSGNGSTKHREFPMASGEMTEAEFTEFLAATFNLMRTHTSPSALIYAFMDWRHMREMLSASRAADLSLLNLCVWSKTNSGMGSFYRSQHELVFVFRSGDKSHLNNIRLGRFARSRTNVWTYPGVNGFGRKGAENLLELHPTTKPIALVANAILDCTRRGDIVLDPFVGSGTTILAAERTGRRGFGIELDPIYVDTAIGRWERMTGQQARNNQGTTFAQIKLERSQA